MIDFEQRHAFRSARRFLEPFRRGSGELPAAAFGAVTDYLLAVHGGEEELLREICAWQDAEVAGFLTACRRSGVAEALDLAASVLIRRGTAGLAEWLEETASEPEGPRWLVDVLAEVHDDDATRWLITFLDHPGETVRRRAADGLASHRGDLDPRAFVRHLSRPLAQGLGRPDPHALVRALHRVADPSLEPSLGKDAARRAERSLINCVRHEQRLAVRGDAVAALGEIGSRAAVRCLVDMLSREDAGFHRDVVIALRKIRPERALMALLGLLRSRDPIIREEAASALGEIGQPRAVARLRELLDDDDPDVRQEAVLALGKLGGRDLLVALERALDDPDPLVRIAACGALADGLGGRAQGRLIRALYDAEPGVRSEAAHLLGDVGDERARRHLEYRLADRERDAFGDTVSSAARRSLLRMEVMRQRRRRAAG